MEEEILKLSLDMNHSVSVLILLSFLYKNSVNLRNNSMLNKMIVLKSKT